MNDSPDNAKNELNPAPAPAAGVLPDPYAPVKLMSCDDIQEVLFHYMNRELGPAQSDLVREHIRRCPNCQAASAEIQETLDALKTDSNRPAPEHLSDDQRKHILWAVTHPIMDWIDRNHMIASVILAIIVMTVSLMLLWRMKIIRDMEDLEIYEVSIIIPSSNALQRVEALRPPEAVNDSDARQEQPK